MDVVELLREAVTDAKRQETQRLVLVNGPPRSGKDTVGRLFEEFYQGEVYVTKFAKRLKEMTHMLYGAPYAHDFFEISKDQPNVFFLGLTPRQAYIAVSNYMKLMHGEDIFGKFLLEDIEKNGKDADIVVVTDSGFDEEAQPLLEHFHPRHMILLQLDRVGSDFEEDSRDYLTLPNIATSWASNNGTILDLAKQLGNLIEGFEVTYSVEVQLPAGTGLMWFEQGQARPTFEQAAAVAESLRQGEYAQRAIRIRTGKDTIVRLMMPGDAPTLELL